MEESLICTGVLRGGGDLVMAICVFFQLDVVKGPVIITHAHTHTHIRHKTKVQCQSRKGEQEKTGKKAKD